MDRVESSIPDTSNIYNYWSTSVYLGYSPSIGTTKSVTLPAQPEFLIITPSASLSTGVKFIMDVLYDLKGDTLNDGMYISFNFNLSTLKLKITTESEISVGMTTYDIHMWY